MQGPIRRHITGNGSNNNITVQLNQKLKRAASFISLSDASRPHCSSRMDLSRHVEKALLERLIRALCWFCLPVMCWCNKTRGVKQCSGRRNAETKRESGTDLQTQVSFVKYTLCGKRAASLPGTEWPACMYMNTLETHTMSN